MPQLIIIVVLVVGAWCSTAASSRMQSGSPSDPVAPRRSARRSHRHSGHDPATGEYHLKKDEDE